MPLFKLNIIEAALKNFYNYKISCNPQFYIDVTDSKARKAVILLTAALLILVASRILILNLTELIDPTESRYAVVSQIMATTDEWVVPMIPMPEGIAPFLGKPPFYFWVTAAGYKLFGFSNVTSRLPSFLFSIVTILTVIFFVQKVRGLSHGILSSLLIFSTTAFYLFSGASATDMTLTAFLTVAIAVFYLWHEKRVKDFHFLLIFSVAASLGFLTKGPVALVFIGFTIFCWGLFTKNYSLFINHLLWKAVILSLAIASPWFIVAELKNPGFLKYFFLQENLGRYFMKDFGSMYGGLSNFPYGASWVMLFLNSLPWSFLVPVILSNRPARALIASEFRSNHLFSYLTAWCFAPVIFLTFIKQLHSAYLLPSIPPFCILILLLAEKQEVIAALNNKIGYFIKFLGCFSAALLCASIYLNENIAINIAIFSAAILACVSINKALPVSQFNLYGKFVSASILTVASFCIITYTASKSLNIKKSTAAVLSEVSARALMNDNNSRYYSPQVIGVISKNNFSFYWFTNKWREEDGRDYRIKVIQESEIPSTHLNLLVEKKHVLRLWEVFKNYYRKDIEIGKWIWLRRNDKFEE